MKSEGRHAVEAELSAAAAACRKAAQAQESGASASGRQTREGVEVPVEAQGWLDLLSGYPEDGARVETLRRIKAAFPEIAVEHQALLQALSVSALRIGAAPVADSVKRCYARLCFDVATPSPRWRRQFDEADPLFMELAKLAALQRFPAGEVVFDIIAMPRSWPLKIHPFSLPGFVLEAAFGVGGFGPFVCPHFNSWRPNPLIMQRKEMLRSLWRMAKTMEVNANLKGLLGDAWFYSAETGELSPHLSWMREIFVEAGAYLVDMEAASADSGFMVGSAKRRQFYDEGKFHPRRTLVLWRQDRMLAWAADHPEWADEGETPPPRPVRLSRWPVRSPPPVRRRRANNGPLVLWRGQFLLNRAPKAYAALTLGLPGLAAAGTAGALGGAWAAAPALAVSCIAAWAFQYFFFQ